MYDQFEFNVTEFIVPGGSNVLAVKVTPEQSLEGENGIELGDSWLDWINWKYLGYQDPQKHVDISFVPDRNAGVWKRVFLSSTGAVTIRNPYVATDLPLPATNPASLTVYCDLSNDTSKPVSGTLSGEISRPGKPTIKFQQNVQLFRNQTKEIAFTPADYAQLTVADPDLWWPYQWGEPKLYHLKLEFKVSDKADISDSQAIDFGIRKITQGRDSDSSFPEIGTGGNFYLQSERQGLSDPRRRLLARSALQKRSGARCDHHALRQGSWSQLASLGAEDRRRHHDRPGRS